MGLKLRNNYNKIKINFIALLIFGVSLTAVLIAQENKIYSTKRDVSGGAQKFDEKNALEYKVFENSKKLYSINIELEYDIPFPKLEVFDNGYSVLINTFESSLTFFNKSGQELVKNKILKDLPVEYERSVYSTISKDLLAISLSQPKMEYSIIQIYNNQGQLISNWDLDEKYINGLAYSSISDLLAVSVYNWRENNLKKTTLFFKSDGIEISRVPYNFTNGKFVENEIIFIGYANEILFVYDLEEIKINFKKSAIENGLILLAEYINGEVFILQAENPYLEKGIWYYKNPNINSFDVNGNLSLIYEIECKPFSECKLVKNGSGIELITENQTLKIK